MTRRSVALNGLAATNPERSELGDGPETFELPAGWGIAAMEFAQLASSANAYPPDGKYQGATTIQGAR